MTRGTVQTNASDVWHIATTPASTPHKVAEFAAGDWLRLNAHCEEAFTPTVEKWTPTPKGSNRAKTRIIRPAVSGYLFARFDRWPRYTWITEQCKWVTGWLQIGDRPVVLTEAALMHMRQVPERLEALREAREAAELERRTYRAGDKAIITDGPFTDWEVAVVATHGDVVVFDTPVGFGKAEKWQMEKC